MNGDTMQISVNDIIQKDLRDDVLIFQTDTVYGIGCLLGSKRGVETIYNIKKRDGQKPLAVLCASIEDVRQLTTSVADIEDLANKYWPGALTLVVPKTSRVPDFVTSGYDTVGIRIPSDPIALTLLKRFGPMAVTSLNISTEPAILSYKDTLEFEKDVDYIVQGSDCAAKSSTVYDVVHKRILRQGDLVIE